MFFCFCGQSTDEDTETLRDKLSDLHSRLKSEIEMGSETAQNKVRSGQAIGQAVNGVVSSGFRMSSAEQKVLEAEEQVLQTNAENTKSFYQTMQQTLGQMADSALQAMGKIWEVGMGVSQTASRPAIALHIPVVINLFASY